jgi:hypothetical protein
MASRDMLARYAPSTRRDRAIAARRLDPGDRLSRDHLWRERRPRAAASPRSTSAGFSMQRLKRIPEGNLSVRSGSGTWIGHHEGTDETHETGS